MTTLAEHYAALDAEFGPEDHDEYGSLVVPNGNAAEPFHRWFHLKEAFSSQLVDHVLGELPSGRGLERLLDPFAGVGTSVISAMQDDRVSASYGIESNPFLALVAQAKVAALTNGCDGLADFAGEVLASRDVPPDPIPGLSSFSNTNFFAPAVLRELLRIKAAIRHLPARSRIKDIARVVLAATIEPVSALRRDGRALRYEPRKIRPNVHEEFARRMQEAAEDLADLPRVGKGRVEEGDGRRPRSTYPAVRPTIALFSPPYPNNIDYTEVYKLEAWLLGLIDDQRAFREQRLRTVRSHPSVQFPDLYPASSNGYEPQMAMLLGPLLASIPAGRYRHARERLVRGYFEDMLQLLVQLAQMQRPADRLIYVVGNSLHGDRSSPLLIASDLLIARIARGIGYEIDRFVVARRPMRRRIETPLLRESVVFLRRV